MRGPRSPARAHNWNDDKGSEMTIETLIWIAVVLVVGAFVWIAEPYHTRMIDAVHGRAAETKAKRKIWLGRRQPLADH